MRVLQLIDSTDPRHGGPPVSAAGLGGSLLTLGVDVEMVTMSDEWAIRRTTTKTPDGLIIHTAPAVRCRGRAFSIYFLVFVLWKARRTDVIIIHGFYLWHVVVGGVVARMYKITLIIQPHGVFEGYQRQVAMRQKRIFDVICGKAIISYAAAVFVASESEAVGAREKCNPTTVAVIRHGVKLASAISRSAPHSPVRLLTMSRLAEKKRIDVVLDCVAALLRDGFPVVLTVAGTGDPSYVRRLMNSSDALGLSSVVSFVGHVDGVGKARILNSSDVLLLPSENENFANAVAEALAAGLPCVVTRAVAISDLFGTGCGRVIAMPDAQLLADAIKDLCRSNASFSCASKMAILVTETELSWKRAATKWLTLVREM